MGVAGEVSGRGPFRCVAGGDGCPGHRSEWGTCTAAEFAAARERTDAEEEALAARERHDATIALLREQLAGQRAARRGGQYTTDLEA